jgi:hypothetical protein
MNKQEQIQELRNQILEAKIKEPNNFRKIQKLQQELDKLYEGRSSAT